MGSCPPTGSKLRREPLLFSLQTTFQANGAALCAALEGTSETN